MTNLREALAGTAFASLEWSEERERAVDRVAASGKASRLGLDLWKAKYMLEAKAYQDTRAGLLQLFRGRYHYHAEPAEIAEKCVEEALSEFLGPGCATCGGARELIAGDLKVVCVACDGSGIRQYTDWERAARMQMSLRRIKSLAYKLRWLAGEMGSMDRSVNAVLADELERGYIGVPLSANAVGGEVMQDAEGKPNAGA